MTKRILITGSRDWTNQHIIEQALADAIETLFGDPNLILVEGECPYGGADTIARDIWETWGRPVEKVPANWKIGKRAGPERNQIMVDRGADICLAFPGPNSRGTWDCVRKAEHAGIPVRIYKDPDND